MSSNAGDIPPAAADLARSPTDAAGARKVLSVSQLTAQIKRLLEGGFASVWVAGEVSNLSRPQSGHVYFTLKDPHAQIRAVVWRGVAEQLRFRLEDGQALVCRGEMDVFAQRGSYQLVLREIEPRGEGALQIAFRQLHARLAAEGLFDPARKRKPPRFPRRIAFVTSPSGAAIHDFLEVLRGRWRGARVLLAPTRVQGEGAAAEIAAAIAAVNRLADPPDVLVVGRGGGSLEDLWCFNEEVVVRAIVASSVPVVSAVGHEIDVTLADLAADVRALTPSDAAARVVPAAAEVQARLEHHQRRLALLLAGAAAKARARLEGLSARRVLRAPDELLRPWRQQIDELQTRAELATRRASEVAAQQLAATAARLESLSPLAVLARGYSVTQRRDGEPVRDARQLAPGELLLTRLHHGWVTSRVEEVGADPTPPVNTRDDS